METFHKRVYQKERVRNPLTEPGCCKRVLGLTYVCLLLSTSQLLAAGSTLKVILPNDLKIVDPYWTTAYVTRNYGYMIYDTLFSLDANLQPQPQMVETWDASADGLTYTFTLRPGLKWHDGASVRAADCVASLKRWGKRDGMGRLVAAQSSPPALQ